jgi:hypothetical protein
MLFSGTVSEKQSDQQDVAYLPHYSLYSKKNVILEILGQIIKEVK